MKTTKEFKLPEKWCVRGDRQEVIDYSNINGAVTPYVINAASYHHYPKFQYNVSYCTTSSEIKKGYTEITFEQFKKYVLNQEMKNKQEYDLVDFKIEDLKEGSIIISSDETHEVQGFAGKIIFTVTTTGYTRIYTLEIIKRAGFKLRIPKPKVEKIQGFEVREYPDLPLVEVSDYPNFRIYVIENLVCVDRKMTTNFFRCSKNNYKYCRPVPLKKRNFIDI